MAYFVVTSNSGNKAIINGNNVSKVVDFGSFRTIYQGADTNNYQVKETLQQILDNLQK